MNFKFRYNRRDLIVNLGNYQNSLRKQDVKYNHILTLRRLNKNILNLIDTKKSTIR